MASDSPDIQSLNTWKDAFQYPISTVRRVEQELRRDIASNKEKLRSLVGYVSIGLVGDCNADCSGWLLVRDIVSSCQRRKPLST